MACRFKSLFGVKAQPIPIGDGWIKEKSHNLRLLCVLYISMDSLLFLLQ